MEIPQEHSAEVRRLVHDLGNALEIMVQVSYLLKMGELDESQKQWIGMLDKGVDKATSISQELRAYMQKHGAGS